MNPSPIAAPERFGKYQILERIASGGMAEIFKARLDGIGGFHRTFAIKRILPNLTANPEFVDLLVEEAKIAGLLSHANIVQILDLGAVDNQYYIAMEYVHGRDLGVLLKRCGEKGITFPVPHAVYVLLEVLRGLEYAHNRQVLKNGKPNPLNIVHRDVSPPNVLVSFQGEVKLTDFGIAKAAVRALETMSGVIKGRFDYMSPEQAAGTTVDQRSDLFSAGVVCYQLLTGRHPFRQASELGTVDAIRRGTYETPSHVNPDVPPSLDRVVARALAVDPADRYPNATMFREDLDKFFRDAGFIFSSTMLASFVRGLFPEVETSPGVDIRAQLPPPTRASLVETMKLPGAPAPAPRTPVLEPAKLPGPPTPPPRASLVQTVKLPLPEPAAPARPEPPRAERFAVAPGPRAELNRSVTMVGGVEPAPSVPETRPRTPQSVPASPALASRPHSSAPADHALRDTSILLQNLPAAPPPDAQGGFGEEATVIRHLIADGPSAWNQAATVIRPEGGSGSAEPDTGEVSKRTGRPTPKAVAEPPPPPRLPEPRPGQRLVSNPPDLRPGASAGGAPLFVHLAYLMVALIALVLGTLTGVFLERVGAAPGEPMVLQNDPSLVVHFPAGATASVNGRVLDVASPATFILSANEEAVVKVVGPGYGPVETRVKLDYNQTRVVDFTPVAPVPKAP